MPEYITDLHFHSKYSRAVSKQMDLEHISEWAAIKGIDVVTATDFTHPAWFAELNTKLEQQDNGLYKLKGDKHGTHFMLTTEVSSIYKRHDQARRVHNVIIAPDLKTVGAINKQLNLIGNLKSDGRPILGLDSEKLLELIIETSPEAMLIPAHIWTPWFSMFGSKSGFNTVEECFGKLSKHITAVETGLSSDPPMNWRLSQLDRMAIVSFSDAHSPANLGREATVFNLKSLSYHNLLDALRNHNQTENSIAYTIEFHPEEGRYHWDGHRACNLRLSPPETKKLKGICPKCKKKLTVGVLYRVQELADREEGYQPNNRPPYTSLVPLREIIAEALGFGVNTKSVQTEYEPLIKQGGNELDILMNLSIEKIKTLTLPKIATAIQKMRDGDMVIEPGYDGEYGIVKIFNKQEDATEASGQTKLI